MDKHPETPEMPCPCGSGNALSACCGVFLSGRKHAPTPEKLMRSRFSAYYLGGHGQYLLQTWWPPMAEKLSQEQLDRRDQAWSHLEILAKSQHGDDGMVEFRAWYRDSNGEMQALHERSVFKRLKQRWLYVGGEIY